MWWLARNGGSTASNKLQNRHVAKACSLFSAPGNQAATNPFQVISERHFDRNGKQMKLIRIFILLLLSTNIHAAIIDTSTEWDRISFLSSFGEGSTDTYGQTFSIPNATENVLRSFSFWIDDRVNPQSVDFAAYVMEWVDPVGIQSPGHAISPTLFQSTARMTTNNGGADGMELFAFNTAPTVLDANKKYVAFLSSSLFWDGINGGGSVGALPLGQDEYIGGEAVIIPNGNNFNLITDGGWNVLNQDFVFRAEFSAVPIPALMWALTSCALGLLGFRRTQNLT